MSSSVLSPEYSPSLESVHTVELNNGGKKKYELGHLGSVPVSDTEEKDNLTEQ